MLVCWLVGQPLWCRIKYLLDSFNFDLLYLLQLDQTVSLYDKRLLPTFRVHFQVHFQFYLQIELFRSLLVCLHLFLIARVACFVSIQCSIVSLDHSNFSGEYGGIITERNYGKRYENRTNTLTNLKFYQMFFSLIQKQSCVYEKIKEEQKGAFHFYL